MVVGKERRWQARRDGSGARRDGGRQRETAAGKERRWGLSRDSSRARRDGRGVGHVSAPQTNGGQGQSKYT